MKEVVHIEEDEMNTHLLDYTSLVPVLIKAIQEQQQFIETQEEKINSQDKNYEKLLKRVEQLELAIQQ